MEKQVTYTTRRWTFTISGLCPPEAGGLASTPPPPPTRTVSATDTTRVHLHPRSKYIITSHSLQCVRNVIKRTIPLKIRGFLYNIEDISLLFFCNEVIRWLVIWRIVTVLVTIHRHRTFILPSHAIHEHVLVCLQCETKCIIRIPNTPRECTYPWSCFDILFHPKHGLQTDGWRHDLRPGSIKRRGWLNRGTGSISASVLGTLGHQRLNTVEPGSRVHSQSTTKRWKDWIFHW